MTTNYFPCKIHNTDTGTTDDSRSGDEPAYAILSMEEDFGLEDAIERVKDVPPANIFIIVNGQQEGDLRTSDWIDKCYGRDLCGIDRIGEKPDGSGIWKGDFKIYTTSAHKSVASTLFDEYGGRDLIIDVVNAKYEWLESATKNTRAFEDFCNNLKKILDPLPDGSIHVFIAGFSRGGMFALRLAEWFRDKRKESKEIIVVTIDPVQKYSKERNRWDIAWADWKDPIGKRRDRWEIRNGSLIPAGAYRFKFPILKATGTKHYNVFQRWGGRGSGSIDQPQGCAVKGAGAPPKNLTKGEVPYKGERPYENLPSGTPYDQFDIVTEDHTDMPGKYRDWVIDIAHKHFSIYNDTSGGIDLGIELTPSCGVPGTEVKISRGPRGGIWRLLKVFFDDEKEVESRWSRKEKIIYFTVPENTNSGSKKVSIKKKPSLLSLPFNSALFEVEKPSSTIADINTGESTDDILNYIPDFELLIDAVLGVQSNKEFIKGEQGKFYRSLTGAKVKIKGKIKKKDEVFLNNKRMKTDFHYNKGDSFLLFEIPKDIGIGKKHVRIKRKGGYLSTSLYLIICDLIGNENTMELHERSCGWMDLIKSSNKQLICSSLDKPKKHGYDNCHWCIGGSNR